MESYLTAQISASAIRANLRLLRQRIPRSTKLCAVVKADCYGHGLAQLVHLLSSEADSLGVATPEEAIHLRRLGYNGPILVFFSPLGYGEGPELREALEELIARGVTLTLASGRGIRAVAEAAKRVDAFARVHVKVDSGMGRSGVLPEATPALVRRIRDTPGIRLLGLYTHFAIAEEEDKAYTRSQLQRFLAAAEAAGGRDGLTLHAANSAATLDLPETHLDMIRPGLAVYGYQPSDQMQTKLPLRPALRLIGRLTQVKDLPAGSRCGYGLRYTFTRDGPVGLVPIGYGDGYLRCLSDKTFVRVRGQLVPTRGTISMDQITVDLTDVPSAVVGDEVEIISPDPTAPNSVESLARLAGTIPYEITCRLGPRIRRQLVK